MDTSRERVTGPEEGASIRLRYSRQFQSGGHAHSIDAEATLPVGANQERREQVIRELESGVEQLARQIAQRASRSTGEARPQAPTRPVASSTTSTSGQSVENAALPALPMQKQTTVAPPAPSRAPISESMPATPAASGEGTTPRLPQFINAIKKRWDMSLKEAMELLHVTTLEGVNLREAYTQLQVIVEAKKAPAPQRSNPQPRITQAPPIVEAPRQENRGTSQQSPGRFPPNSPPPNSPGPRAQSPIALREVSRSAPPTVPVNTPLPEPSSLSEAPRGLEAGVDFAGSPKAPLPIKLATVRDISARSGYKFEEEDDDENEEYELPDNDDLINLRAQSKLDELKAVRGSNAASAERLAVLSTMSDGLVSEDDLLKLIKGIWGHTTPKKLKTTQVEKLISWAKEDDFAAEVEAILDLLKTEGGE